MSGTANPPITTESPHNVDLTGVDPDNETWARQRRALRMEARHARLRLKAKDDFLSYAGYMVPGFMVNHHHRAIANALMDCEAGRCDRLMITTPPRHGKSLLCSVLFPAWFLGRRPDGQVIAASYGSELISGFGRRLRNMVRQPDHTDIFGEAAGLSPDSRARDMWLTNGGGIYRAVGTGGGVTGFGGHCIIIDDPVRGIEDADSPTVQAKTWEWYQADLLTRCMKGGFIVVVQTRWNMQDLSGKLLELDESGEGDKWRKVHFPAIDDDGKALWPEMYDVPYFDRIRRTQTPRHFQALYQGDPLPESGNLFTEDMFEGQTFATMPDLSRMRFYGASDYAVSFGKGDWTVHVVVGVDSNLDIYLVDMWRARERSDVSVDAQLRLMNKWKTLLWAGESGQIARSLGPFIRRRQMETGSWGAIREFSSAVDKAQRIQPFLARFGSGKVYLPRTASWYGDLKREMLAFPLGSSDDMVDALGLIGRLLDAMSKGRALPGEMDLPSVLTIGGKVPAGMRGVTMEEIARDAERGRRI